MSALDAFIEFLQDRINGIVTEPIAPVLLEAFRLCLSLALHTGNNKDILGPPTRKFQIKNQPDTFSPLIFVNEDRHLLYLAESDMACFQLSDGAPVKPPKNAASFFKNLKASPDGVYQADRYDFVNVFDRKTKDVVMELSWPRMSKEACTVNVAFSPDNRFIAVSYAYDQAIRIWDFQSKIYMGEMIAPDHEAAIAFSPDNRFLLAGTKSGVCLFHIESKLRVWKHRAKQCYAVGYSSDGLSCAYVGEGEYIVTVDLQAFYEPLNGDFEEILEIILDHWSLWEGHMQWETVYSQAIQF